MLLLLACADRGNDTADDDATEVPCLPWSLARTQSLTMEELAPGVDEVLLRTETGPGVAMADIDGDDDLDVLLTVNQGASVGLRNEGGVLIPDPTITADGGTLPPANGIATADLDGDGDADFAVSAPEDAEDFLLYNDGAGRFESRRLAGSTGEGMTPTLADWTGDGRLDLVIAGFNPGITGKDMGAGLHLGSGTQLFVQGGDGTFLLDPDGIPEAFAYDLTYGAFPWDPDSDGDLDLYFNNDYGNQTGVPCVLLANDGLGNFAPAAVPLTELLSAMGSAMGDPDGDGDIDMFVANWGPHRLYVGGGDGTFHDGAQAAAVRRASHADSNIGWSPRFADLDGDTWEDLAVAFGAISYDLEGTDHQPDALFHNDGDGTFTDITADLAFGDVGIARSIAAGDLDGDGSPDLLVAGRVYLLVYLSSGGCPSARVRLDGEAGNRSGIGARVDVETRYGRFSRWMLPASTFSSSPVEWTLGLGGAGAAQLMVTWPDGAETAANVDVGDTMTIARD